MDIQERLAKAVQAINERRKLLHRREATVNLIQEKKNDLKKLKKQLEREMKDVEQLDGITLQNFWHSIRGTKEIARHKEQEEYLAAKMKFDAANAALEGLEADIRRIDKELASLGDCEEAYQLAIADKEKYLLSSDSSDAQRLFALAEQYGDLQSEFQEMEEAIISGQKATKALAEVESSLGSAKGWGIVDILGGGLITTAIKHSHIGTARQKINQAQQLLCNFRTELGDVQKHNATIEIGGISTMADFLLDGLLFDWIVQSQINIAQNRIRQLRGEISSIIQELREMQEKNRRKASQLEEERKRIIVNTPIR